jgi:ribosomal protein S18 acetylase RimI-like enzyme
MSDLAPDEQKIITDGFAKHSDVRQAPPFNKTRINWLAHDNGTNLIGALTASLLWDWIYIDELWVHDNYRDQGLGKKLMMKAEDYAKAHQLSGLWLWTQSWQAADFYRHLGYVEFAEFKDFPKGYSRIGFRKQLGPTLA